MRPWRRIRRALLQALIPFLISPLAGADHDPFNTYHVLGDDGSIFEWSSGGAILRRAASPLGFTELGAAVKDLASFAEGSRLIVLTANPDDPGKGRKRREGLAVVYDTSRPVPTVMHRILLEGAGYSVAAADDGRRCYILASRLDVPRGGPRFWIHALDPEEGRVTSTTQLDRPGANLAVAPDGTRLFVSFDGRIQSYTTKPLLTSWHYRSPNLNGRLDFPPGSDILYALRSGGVALFDPVTVLSRDRTKSRNETDDATGWIPLPFGASAILFSEQRPLAAVLGSNSVTFIDLSTGTLAPSPERPAILQEATVLRPLEFLPGGDLLVGLFPAAIVTAVPTPAPPPAAQTTLPPGLAAGTAGATVASRSQPGELNQAPTPDLAESIERIESDDGAEKPAALTTAAIATGTDVTGDDPVALAPPRTNELSVPVIVPEQPNKPEPEAVPETASDPPPVPATGSFLSGRLSGEHALVAALVLYGPDSIIREYARVAPAADGRFRIPLPPPGTYRLVPVGEASRPVAASPNFHTVSVQTGRDRTDLDFSIERGP